MTDFEKFLAQISPVVSVYGDVRYTEETVRAAWQAATERAAKIADGISADQSSIEPYPYGRHAGSSVADKIAARTPRRRHR